MNNELVKIPLEDASPELREQFAAMLAADRAEAALRAAGHRCWTWVPNRVEYERMAKYADDNDTCPKCGTGRVVLEIFKGGGFGDSYWLKCYWSKTACDFKECVNDESR